MTQLKKDWITDGLIDFEYKKYVLLAYLKHVEQNFDQTKLFPFMTELIDHYRDAKVLKDKKQSIQSEMPREISRLDLNKLEIIYKDLNESDELLKDIEEIVDYALPTMQRTLGKGKEIHEWVESELKIDPIGIIPMYKDEGYVMLELGNSKLTDVFQYQIKKFIMFNEQMRGVYFKLIDRVSRGIGDTFEQIKLQLIKSYKVLPNPATFVIHGELPLPMEETVIPMSKKLVLKTVQQL
ncbi:MAG: hypothetical protein JJ978_09475 [Roseivirga sp.]|jgi:hypothetical protein|uniref:hypothetical protein n=1 Tax=Roseivirga sp. TaxID=1964215 RepID=UPI001B1337A3|nr:hypothetical protein [Roseivirga sp.]MBO6495785.1 hypothetical protein [Roseivirga sp.]